MTPRPDLFGAAAPRPAYLLSGPARAGWEHGILRVEALRYSITFSNLREGRAPSSLAPQGDHRVYFRGAARGQK
jgi:hypothetical protein